ncbi:hypothetical protein WJX72_008984 [[Myrmecia] bisecta]|uniref:Purple acid phosphatase n=1 Tax=[Myrmecia] bisecta TaxID=41462 RepID=A0AAW1QS33_9CHLO
MAALVLAWSGRTVVSNALKAHPVRPAFKPRVTLKVNTTVFSHGDCVSVSWAGAKRPTQHDAIALFSPGDASPEDLDPLKYQWAMTSVHHLLNGSGSVTFRLLNQRHDVAALFFYNVSAAARFSNATLAGRSEVMQLAEPNEPLQGHLALTPDASEMLVQWTTRDAGSPVVKWGTQPGTYEHIAAGRSVTYTKEELCGAPAKTTGFVDPGALNSANMKDLQPNTWYYYVFGDQELRLFSTEASFLTGPPVGPDSSISFIATSDYGHAEVDGSQDFDYEDAGDVMNYAASGSLEEVQDCLINVIVNNESQQRASRHTTAAILADMAASKNKTLMFINGDISYARGQLTQWDVFHDNMEALLRQIPVMVQDGNHERDFPNSGDRYETNIGSGGECGIPAHKRFQMPFQLPDSRFGRGVKANEPPASWYSFDHGPVHFLQYSTEVDFSLGSPQHRFIVKDLTSVDRSQTPWVVVGGHRPIYSTSINGGGKSSVVEVAHQLRAILENVFYTHHVDLTLHGHDHIYERTCPIYRRNCLGYDEADGTAKAPVNVVIGNAGYGLGWFVNPDIPPYWESVVLEHGYLRCDANRTVLHCQEVSSMTGRLLDEFTLRKPVAWRPDQVGRRALRKKFVSKYEPLNDIETKGLSREASAESIGPVLAILQQALRDNVTLLESLRAINNRTHRLTNAVTGPDTVVDLWTTLQPVKDIMHQVAGANTTTELGATTLRDVWIPIVDRLQAVAEAYSERGGIYRSSWLDAAPPP